VSPARRILIAVIVLVTGALGYAAGRSLFRPSREVGQPIAFNHQKHVEEVGVECDTCHEFYRTGKHAGLPGLSVCMGCHEEAQTESPEEQKIRDLAEAGDEDVFRKLFRMPDNVFYSHRRHAGIGEIPCETCHGNIAAMTVPPQYPQVRITMDFCIDCHARQDVNGDCTSCHR